MKTTIKRHRRMTKHRKGTTKPRKSIRRIKNRRYKTRRQSGGGYTSFINANENKDANGQTGIDVKVSTDRHSDGNPMSWLIGGNRWLIDATFGELKSGAKGGRYQDFIAALETDTAFIKTPTAFFTNPGRDADSSKGIRLTHDQFCRLLINGLLHYPELKKRFTSNGFTCPVTTTSGPSAALRAPMSAAFSRAPTSAAVRPSGSAATQRQRPPDFSALSDASFFMPLAPQQQQQPLQQQPVTTKYLNQLQEIKKIRLNVTDQLIAQVLNNTRGNIKDAVAILKVAAYSEQSSAVSPSATIQERATIQDFLNAQNGTLPQILGGTCPTYAEALNEIKAGRKVNHWIWYIIPSSPGQRAMSKFFGIGNHSNVTPEQYLSNPTLGARYVKILNAIGAQLDNFLSTHKSITDNDVKQFLIDLMGSEIDFNKLRDSLSIFSKALTTQGKVTPEIALLALHLGVKLYAPPPGPPPGPSAAGTSAALMSAAPMSAAPMSAAGTSAAGTSAAMPIQQIAPQYAPVSTAVAIADLMVPDNFVIKYANAHGIYFDEKESYHKDTHGRTLINFTACPDIADWTVMSTIGDGNCLTHAFLQCTSSMYRKIHVNDEEIPNEKIAVAQAFRLEFARINDPKFLLDENPNIMREFTDGNGRKDLGEGTFAFYAALFNVILVVFDIPQNTIMVANLNKETAIPDMQVIFIHGDGGHYSSVLPIMPSISNKPFVLYYEDAKRFDCLTHYLSLENPIRFNL